MVHARLETGGLPVRGVENGPGGDDAQVAFIEGHRFGPFTLHDHVQAGFRFG